MGWHYLPREMNAPVHQSKESSPKAVPVTEVARESISVAKNVASNIASSSALQLNSTKIPRNPSLQLTRKAGALSRSLPANATTTRINIASDGSTSTPAVDSQPDPTGSGSEPASKETLTDRETNSGTVADKVQPNTATEAANINPNIEVARPNGPLTASRQQTGWFTWFYSPSTTEANTSGDPVVETPIGPSTEHQTSKENNAPFTEQDSTTQDNSSEISEIPGTSQKRSWFQMWYGASSSKFEEIATNGNPPVEETIPSLSHSTPRPNQDINNTGMVDDSADAPIGAPADAGPTNVKPSSWSFWFRDNSQDPGQGKPQELESAEASIKQEQSFKKPDIIESESQQKLEISKKGTIKIKSPKSGSTAPNKITPGPDVVLNTPMPNVPEAAASRQLQKILPNQVLPHFKDTFALQERPSLLQTIGRFLNYNKESNNKHVYMARNPPYIKNALAIGIHGYFPAPLIRTVLGQPTGTSIRFSNMAADAIQKWVDDHGYTCKVEKIALEGEGRIAERVDLLWKLLLNWMEEIRKADFILVACHSQGVPVAIMLVAKLISFGCLNASRVGVCAMAGVNMGPFSDFRSRWISGSAGELFDFALPYSQVSKDYEVALKTSLEFGVRISYVGSIDDQLVSLESSLFSPVTHPYIYRAVFVDGRVHAPSFVSHLVGFALKLRNLGIPDHGLIRELSSPLAGSLYTGEGHSQLYNDEAVYRLAIEFALETSSVQGATIEIKRSHPSSQVNPYILPFAMRGLLEEEFVRRELYDETIQLLRQFDEWKPTSKVLKDVKFRLEGIRSKL
ncbi:hypothetical protein EYZ11_002569 [Aspergillus tanneri]|uniref:YMC020W-like alpha/beta hydrolase domain-containing protein n=1 Tax=Aspergillus tanneri TaxID=1220188 RepID=A0A4S3JQI8_9EURO|nr:hypothetical protein EYZ11_002569 [Aspergillus tanneri]